MEFHVQQYLALPGYTECIFYLISGLSWTLCAGSSVGEATAAVVMYCRTLRFLFCFTRRLQLAWLSSDSDHVSSLCWSLASAGYITCEPGEDLANEIKLTDKTIIYMENKFKNGLKSVLEFLAQFK